MTSCQRVGGGEVSKCQNINGVEKNWKVFFFNYDCPKTYLVHCGHFVNYYYYFFKMT